MKLFNIVRDFLKKNPHAWLALYLPIFLICFFATESIVGEDAEYWLSYLPLDDRIPFVEAFVIPYVCWYPFLILTGLYLLLFDGKQFKKYICFVAVGFTAALIFCLISPNGQALRPAVFPRENLFTAIIAGLYSVDTCTNVFPSTHVIGAVAAAIPYFYCPRLKKLRVPAAVLAALITVSTVFIKQHSVLDILGAFAFCLPLYIFIYFLPERRKRVK